MNTRPDEPAPGPRVFTNDPVRVSWVLYGFVQAVVTVLLLAKIISEVAGGVITGVALAAYVAISELFVRPATVPREPLAELAAAAAAAAPGGKKKGGG